MTTEQLVPLEILYEQDETAWLEEMSALADAGRADQLDLTNLSEYLLSMANSTRREVRSRLVGLLMRMLKWQHQVEKRSGSWQVTIRCQRRELDQLLQSRKLRRYAEAAFAKAYSDARQDAADETGLGLAEFPADCPWQLVEVLESRVES